MFGKKTPEIKEEPDKASSKISGKEVDPALPLGQRIVEKSTQEKLETIEDHQGLSGSIEEISTDIQELQDLISINESIPLQNQAQHTAIDRIEWAIHLKEQADEEANQARQAVVQDPNNEQLKQLAEAADLAAANATRVLDTLQNPKGIVRNFLNITGLNESLKEAKITEKSLLQKRREIVKNRLEMLMLGDQEKRISLEDLEFIIKDFVDDGLESELTNNFLQGRGFENMQHALRSLQLREIKFGSDDPYKLKDKGIQAFLKSPAVSRVLKGTAISSSITLGLAAGAFFLSGPVSWGVIGAGLGGGLAGRLIGEAARTGMLKRKKTDELKFNEAVMRDLYETISQKQTQFNKIMSENVSEEDKYQGYLNLILQMSQESLGSSQIAKDYKQMDKTAKRLTSALTLIAAVGGSFGTAWLEQGVAFNMTRDTILTGNAPAEANPKLAELKELLKTDGLNLDLDRDGIDHTVKLVEGEYRFLLEQGDIARAEEIAGKNYADWWHYILPKGEGAADNISGRVADILNTSPNNIPDNVLPGQEASYFHKGTIDKDAIEVALAKKVYTDSLNSLFQAFMWAGITAAPTVWYELVVGRKKTMQEKAIYNDRRRLINSSKEIEEHIQKKIYFGFTEADFKKIVKVVGDPRELINKDEELLNWYRRLSLYYKRTYNPEADFEVSIPTVNETWALREDNKPKTVTKGSRELIDTEIKILSVNLKENRVEFEETKSDNKTRSSQKKVVLLTDLLKKYVPNPKKPNK